MNEIGEILKEARIEQGYTLDDLQQITKIQKRYLQAIEDGNTEILPGRFYMRAFVKQYADIVGLDGEELLEGHLDESSKEASEEFAEQVNVAPTRTQGKSASVFDNLGEYLPTLLIFLLVAAIAIVIYFAWTQTDGSGDPENSMINQDPTEQVEEPGIESEEDPDNADTSEEDADAESADNAENADEEETEEETEEQTEEQTITVAENNGADTTFEITGTHPEEQTVTLTASGGDTWVSITAGSESDAGLLTDGQSMSVSFGSDVTQVDLVIGNAPVTEVTLNDLEVQYAPEAAGIVRQDLVLQFSE